MPPKTNEYLAENVAINLDGRTITSHEHFREMVKKEVLFVLSAKDKEREEAVAEAIRKRDNELSLWLEHDLQCALMFEAGDCDCGLRKTLTPPTN